MTSKLQNCSSATTTQLNMDSGEFSLIQVYMGHLNDFLNYSVYTVRRLRTEWDILSTRKQKHSAETIHAKVSNICECHPLRGLYPAPQIPYGIRSFLRIPPESAGI